MQAELEAIETLRQDTRWLHEHIEELRRTYAGQFVAVKTQQVINSNKSLTRLLRMVKKSGTDPATILVEFVSAKPVRVIL